MESTLPSPGTVSPRATRNVPLGPSNTAVPFVTSRSVQPSMVVGLVSGAGASFTVSRALGSLTSRLAASWPRVPSFAASRSKFGAEMELVEQRPQTFLG